MRRSGPATAGDNSNVNTGIQIFRSPPSGRVARSVYLHHVQQIFPGELVGRDAELAELEAFCTGSDGGSYVWWQGPAWAGKSALMAWFVLHRPDGVRVVSFFITARYAGQSDRSAFLEAVLEQLAEVAGQPMPDLLTESNRQGWFGRLLHDAAAACERDGLRLVLLVDGLDEDQGVTGRADAHSIAALLPAAPPTGARVIVAGRPNPPVPADVPQWHPLRAKEIVRPLSVSPRAQMVRDDAERELGHLLDGGGLGRKLLGLVTAAGGGLSGDDLAELTGKSPGKVEKVLRAVSGRTFRSRDTRWQASEAPVFVLAHEELQQTATRNLGFSELVGLRDQLHGWADQYRKRGWLAGTPEYLLGGYHRLLHTIGDVERMTALATDRARLDRMLDVSGGDAAALAEITTVQEFICGQDHPDLTAMLNLAITRDWLTQRNNNIPTDLPAVWATLGNPTRAEALARSIADPSEQARALAAVVHVLVEVDNPNQARQLARQAETIARSIADPWPQAVALTAAADALAVAGDLDQARQVVHRAVTVARSITSSSMQAVALADVAKAMAGAGEVGQAVTIARSITDPFVQARALADVARALVRAGEVGQAVTIARSITDPSGQARALAAVAEALAVAGDLDQARQVAHQAEITARSITDPFGQARALAAVAEALAGVGEVDQALSTARSITDPSGQVPALAAVAEALAVAGDLDRARRAAHQAEITARSITDPFVQVWALADVARALVGAGEFGQAVTIACSIADPWQQARALTAAVMALLGAGYVDQAETIARYITDPSEQARALADVAKELVGAGDVGQAETIACSPSEGDIPVLLIAEAAAHERSRQLLASALAQTRNYASLLPFLAKFEPIAVIKAAHNIPSETGPCAGTAIL